MNDFMETPRYPGLQGIGSGGGPGFKTFIGQGRSAFERRVRLWDQVRGRWDLKSGLRDSADIDVLKAYFMACYGRAVGFRLKDLADYTAVAQPLGTGDGVTTVFRMKKRYTTGSNTYDRRIFKPVTGTVIVYGNAVVISSILYTINYTVGTVTFTVAPALGVVVTASFEFDVPVRFDTDEFNVSPENWDQQNVGKIPVVELRLED